MTNNLIPNQAFTHGGKFHADDVFSAALLKTINPNITIERGFTVPEDFEGIVFDIGFGEFDHHQADSPVRENGVPYAAFGLLWEEFGGELVGEEEADKFDRSFIQSLDLCDNTGCDNAIAKLISMFNPSWDEEKDVDAAFQDAVDFALIILERNFGYLNGLSRAEAVVRKALETAKDQILILPTYAPWKSVVEGTDILFVVYPSDRGGYNAQAVPSEEENQDLKIPFPEEWRGVEAEKLKEISGIETLSFCHSSGFLIAADTLEDVIKACKEAERKEKTLQ